MPSHHHILWKLLEPVTMATPLARSLIKYTIWSQRRRFDGETPLASLEHSRSRLLGWSWRRISLAILQFSSPDFEKFKSNLSVKSNYWHNCMQITRRRLEIIRFYKFSFMTRVRKYLIWERYLKYSCTLCKAPRCCI